MPVKQSLCEEWLCHAKLSFKLLTLSQRVSYLRFIQLAQSNDKIQINFTNICFLTHTCQWQSTFLIKPSNSPYYKSLVNFISRCDWEVQVDHIYGGSKLKHDTTHKQKGWNMRIQCYVMC